MDKISIILLNYNWWKFNKPCLDSILRQSYTNFEIVFVNNLSTDWSLEEAKKIYTKEINIWKMKIIENKENYGFAEGNNIGVKYTDKDAKYICLINNDTVVEVNWLEELIQCIESDETLWLVGSLVLDKWHEEEMKDLLFKKKKMGVNNYIMETSFRNLTDQEIKKWIVYTTGISWCGLIYKKDLIQQPFPSFYFAYGEDTYLSHCILLQGYKVALCTTAIINHFWSGSFWRKTTLLKAFHGAKNQLCNILILHTSANSIKLIPTYLLYQWIKIFSSDINIRFRWLCKAIARCIRHRKEIQQQKTYIKNIQKISNKEYIRQLSDKIFENIYFLPIPKYQIYIMNILNTLSKLYFRLVGIR